MTRAKETPPGSGQMPEYKSHPSRINISLRKAYDNLRGRLNKKSAQINRLRGNKRDLEVSRKDWKAEVGKQEEELEKSQKDLEKANERIEQLEAQLKKKADPILLPTDEETPHGFKYPVRGILLAVKGVLTTGAGFRGVSAVLSLVGDIFGELTDKFITPAYSTIRQWVLKLGLYKLQRPKNQDGTWIHIVDATVQMGALKAVLILGLRIDDDVENSFNPSFEQLEPLVLKTVTNCPGEIIEEALHEASEKTGVPAAILSDDGGEMNRGARLRSMTVPVVHLHDCLHKTSNLLKKILKNDEQWSQFKSRATATTQDAKLSDIAHLTPPRQRSKARLMASVSLVKWGINVLGYIDSKPDISDELKEKIEWIVPYRKKLQEWMSMHTMATAAITVVLETGYHKGTFNQWRKRVAHVKHRSSALNEMCQGLKIIIQSQSDKVPEGVSYPGCSSCIESGFGKFKSLEGQFSSLGLTELVLALPALMGPTTAQEVSDAMASVHVNDVEDWLSKNLGQTYLTKRRADLSLAGAN